jgi:hypothetical protein
MAKGTVKLICEVCGKEFVLTRDFYSRDEAREWQKRQGTRGTCPECWGKKKAAEREAKQDQDSREAAAKAEGCPLKFPELTGSPKQIAWATDIRNKVIAQLVEQDAKWDLFEANEDPEVQKELAILFDASAKNWIENRGHFLFDMIQIK